MTTSSLVKIISLEYSCSTLLDMALSSHCKDLISLGEAQRSIGLQKSIQYICSCGKSDCSYWQYSTDSYPDLLSRMRKKTRIVDSSKTLSSLTVGLDSDTVLILIYKPCLSWSISVAKRLLKLEVRPWAPHMNPRTQLLAFLRIEILRRLLIPIPFEWLYRNCLIFYKAVSACRSSRTPFYIISSDSLCSSLANQQLDLSRSHILRGNRVRNSRTISVQSSRTPMINPFYLFDAAFDMYINLFLGLTLSTFEDILSAISNENS